MRLYGCQKNKKYPALLCFTILICLFAFFIHSLKTINSVGTTVAVQKITELMNTCALEHIQEAGEIYKTMYIKEKNSNGSVAAIDTDIEKLNFLQTDIAELMTTELKEQRKIKFSISLLNLLGYNIISDYGIKIPIEFTPIAKIETKFKESFISAGINQTMLTVNLEIRANMRIHIFPKETVQEIVHTVPIAKTVIVGDIPNGFYTGQFD